MTQVEFLEGLYTTGKASVNVGELRQVLQKNISLKKENKKLREDIINLDMKNAVLRDECSALYHIDLEV